MNIVTINNIKSCSSKTKKVYLGTMDSKTFAIITDIHSNLVSLIKALSIIDDRDDVDQVICLGDNFSLGPEPEKTFETLKAIPDCIFIRGNHDRYVLEKLWEENLPSLEGMDPYDPICQAIVQNEKWTANALGLEGKQFISQMKIAHREIVGNILIEFTHAWYQRDDKPPSVAEALNWRDHVIDSNPEIEKVVFVHGHVHVPRHQVVENLTILCQGSTGLSFDRDQRGSVAFLSIGEEIEWDTVRFEYDYETTINRLEERKPPFYSNLKKTLKYATIQNDN